jgi:hypothetical protein
MRFGWVSRSQSCTKQWTSSDDSEPGSSRSRNHTCIPIVLFYTQNRELQYPTCCRLFDRGIELQARCDICNTLVSKPCWHFTAVLILMYILISDPPKKPWPTKTQFLTSSIEKQTSSCEQRYANRTCMQIVSFNSFNLEIQSHLGCTFFYFLVRMLNSNLSWNTQTWLAEKVKPDIWQLTEPILLLFIDESAKYLCNLLLLGPF